VPEALAAAQRLYAGFAAADGQAIVDALDPRFVGRTSAGLPHGLGGTYEGPEAMLREVWAKAYALYDFRPEPSEYLEVGADVVVVLGSYEGVARATGTPVGARFAHVLRMRDGRVVALEQITDSQRWVESLGPNPDDAARNAAVVRSVFDGVRRRDLAPLLRAYAEDVVIREPDALPYGGEYFGHEGATAHAAGFVEAWDRFQPAIAVRDPQEVLLDSGDKVLARWHLKGVARDGAKIDDPAVSVFTMRAGRVVELRMLHYDTAALVGFLTGAGPVNGAHQARRQ